MISAIANDLFYEGNLVNGISERERSPVLEWLPTLCFYNVTGTEQVSDISVDGNHYLISWFNFIVVVYMVSFSLPIAFLGR